MEWISAVKRNSDNDLCVEVQDQQGNRSLKCLKDVHEDLRQEGDIRKSLAFKLNDVKPVSAEDYLADLGLQHLDASCQAAYQFDIDKEQLIIPSQLLIMSIMGTTTDFRSALFRPWGLESFMTAFRDGNEVRYKIAPIRPAAISQLSWEKCQKRLRWLSSFPSVRAAWSSVYRNALEGRFDTTLPIAQVTMSMYCRQVNGRLLVTKATLGTIEALEEPHAFMKGAAVAMSLHHSVISERFLTPSHRKVATEVSIAELVPGLRLTDHQWECVNSILRRFVVPTRSDRSDPHGYPTRSLMDAMFIKIGLPLGSRHELSSKTWHAASALLHRFQTTGLWDKILEALQKQSEALALHALENENNEVLEAA